MTDAYRQKLLNWFCSVVLVLSTAFTGAAIHWYLRAPDEDYGWLPAIDMVVSLNEPILFGSASLLAILVWHLADLAQTKLPKPIWLKALFSHRFLLASLLISQASIITICTGALDIKRCFWHVCAPGPPIWLERTAFIPLLIVSTLGIAKVTFAIANRYFFENDQASQ
ncbi:hypothetical protein [Aurantiacibacter sediminis]|uniref:DUF2975 domain-containing protein n=1 Tax=Aurantiacibacter sediminis TaxID=2793064 RepID=A0ABS0N2X9_9SPHN|nr:hypothetical protein [Aurantiacibacter sediminis]MBH5322320.1 hypothetical protein [Aurantiacibacter sediminis]